MNAAAAEVGARRGWAATAGFTAILLVVAAHTLRNVTATGYGLAYALAALASVVVFLRSPWRARLADRGVVPAIWVALALWAGLTTLVVSSPGAAVSGLAHWLFTAPVFLALVGLTADRRQLVRHALIIVGVFCLQAWTLPAQIVTGRAWSFFAEATIRAGATRYASAVGSVTSLGIIVGCYLVCCQLVPRRWRWLAVALLAVPALASLSKAALLNVALGVLILLWLNRRDWRFLLAGLATLAALAAILVVAAPDLVDRFSKQLLSFGGGSVMTDDQSVTQSGVERLTVLPAQNWEALLRLGSPLLPLTGGGYALGDTALVSQADAIGFMAHNQYVECMTVFGVPGALLLLGLLALLAAACARQAHRTGDPLYRAATGAWLLLALNSLTANGTLYQPAAGTLLALLAFISLATPQVASRTQEDPHGPARTAGRAAPALADRAGRVRARRARRHPAGEAAARPDRVDHEQPA